MLKISNIAAEKVSHAILITGSARSGTTIMGKVVSSFAEVEYTFEPPLLFSLFALIEEMEPQQWKLLYETYLYEEFMLNALAGRTINCNRSDDSSIYNVKSPEEIQGRLNRSLSKQEAEVVAGSSIVVYKMPDIVPYLGKLNAYYPATRVVVMLRGAVETLNSLLNKGWFNEVGVRENLIWPFRVCDGVNVPYWVRKGDDELWVGLSEIDRAAYYYIRVNEGLDGLPDRIELRYDELVSDPRRVVEGLSERLHLEFGTETERIIREIKPSTPERDYGIIDRIRPDLRKKVNYYSSLSCS